MRKNGFSTPLDRLQILSWVLVGLCSILFYCVYLPAMNIIVVGVCAVLYTILFSFTFYFNIQITASNPADPTVISLQESSALKHALDLQNYREICIVCKTNVHTSSKHCKECDKCIIGFDHHCKWLNNCIGLRNYRLFCYLIGSVQSIMIFQICVGIYILHDVFTESNVTYSNLKERMNLDDFETAFIILVCIGNTVAFIVSIAMANLIGLHIYLYLKGYTTYDYICILRERSKLKISKVSVQRNPNRSRTTARGSDLDVLSIEKPPALEDSSSKLNIRSSLKVLPNRILKSNGIQEYENSSPELSNLHIFTGNGNKPQLDQTQEIIDPDISENDRWSPSNILETFSKM